jgi:hypothetical protein
MPPRFAGIAGAARRALSGAGAEPARATSAPAPAASSEIAVFGAASEAFSQKNINASIEESLERFAPVIEAARADGVAVRGYVSTVLGCPYQGEVPWPTSCASPRACTDGLLRDLAGRHHRRRHPGKAARDAAKRWRRGADGRRLAVHFHDTYGQALANIAGLPRGGRARGRRLGRRTRRLPLRRRAPAAMWPAKTWSIC